MERKPLRVAVIMGGTSTEREISLKTGQQVAAALRSRQHYVEELDVTPDLATALLRGNFDVVYIALHGRYGEDGCIQGFLEILGLPYVGSGVLASAIGMDKFTSRRLLEKEGLPVPPYLAIRERELSSPEELVKKVEASFGFPVVVKPNAQGSAVGVTIIRKPEDLYVTVRETLSYDGLVLVEKYLPGKEVTVTILGNDPPEALPVIEIVPRKEFYDYEAKYSPGMSEHLIPARLSQDLTRAVQEISVRAYQVIGCRDFARVDLLVWGDTPYVLEVNTLPGMTATSLVPDAARAVGIDFPSLVEKLLFLALARSQNKQKDAV